MKVRNSQGFNIGISAKLLNKDLLSRTSARFGMMIICDLIIKRETQERKHADMGPNYHNLIA